MTKYAMVIDLQRCGGCGACILACKNENNTPEGINWASKISRTAGKFPNVRYEFIPTLCNHCEYAPCIKVCPTTAMHKIDGGITMHDPDKCIGCKACMAACPYGSVYYNWGKPHREWNDNSQTVKDATSSPSEVINKLGGIPLPYYNPDREETLPGVRPNGVVEKCTFCDHRVGKGKLPYCVERCPASARIFGDMDDPQSPVNQLTGMYRPMRLREDLGTEPKIYYIRDFNPGTYIKTKGGL